MCPGNAGNSRIYAGGGGAVSGYTLTTMANVMAKELLRCHDTYAYTGVMTTKRFLPAAQVLPGDRLYKHGVTVKSVGANEFGEVVFEYSHKPGKFAAHKATTKFHVARKAA